MEATPLPQGNELSFLSPPLLQKESQAWRLRACSGPSATAVPGLRTSWAVEACGPGTSLPTGGMCFAERKWLKPDIALFVSPVKKRDHFTLLFYLCFRDQAVIFNSSSFLLSTGVSCGGAVRKNRAHDILSFVPEISKTSPRFVTCACRLGSPLVHTRPLHSSLCAVPHAAVR